MRTTQFGQPLSAAAPLPTPQKKIQVCHVENSYPARFLTPNPASTRTPSIRAPLPMAVSQCLLFLMPPRGLCLSVTLPPPNSRSGETGVVSLWALQWGALQPPPDLF